MRTMSPAPDSDTREDRIMDIDEIQVREKTLFDEWQNCRDYPHPQFVEDGVLNPTVWSGMSPRLLFVLKEANSPAPGRWDMRGGLRQGAWSVNEDTKKEETWRNFQVIARWVHDLTSGGKALDWSQINDEALGNPGVKFKQQALNKAAIVNVKKIGGGPECNMEQLKAYAAACGQFLKRQIRLYKPDLVVWSASAGIFGSIYPEEERTPWERTTRGITWCSLKAWPCGVVDFYHFGYRAPAVFMHYALVDACREVLAKLHKTEAGR